MAEDHPPNPHGIVLDVLAAATDGEPVDFAAARSSLAWWCDQFDARAKDPTAPEPFGTAAARTAIRVRRLLDVLDQIEDGELDRARDTLLHALIGPIPSSKDVAP